MQNDSLFEIINTIQTNIDDRPRIKKVKISLLKAVENHRVARGRGSHIS
jgi:hypothetical protein